MVCPLSRFLIVRLRSILHLKLVDLQGLVIDGGRGRLLGYKHLPHDKAEYKSVFLCD